MIKFIRNVIGFIRALFWKINTKIKFDFNSYIGPFSLLTYIDGKFTVKGRIYARSGFKLCLDGGSVTINGNIFFNNDVSINCMKSIQIGSGCIIGENVKIYDHDHAIINDVPYSQSGFVTSDIIIGNNVWIGSNVTILKGVRIGDNSVIAANTTVYKNVPHKVVFIDKGSLIEKPIF